MEPFEFSFGKKNMFHKLFNKETERSKLMCTCGECLEYNVEDDIFYSHYYAENRPPRINYKCPECKNRIDLSNYPAVIRNGLTGNPSTVNGGASYRFSIVIDCDKSHPLPKEDEIFINHELMELCENILECSLYEVNDYIM